jgi:hypothetical protein
MKTKHAIMRLLRISELHYGQLVEGLGYQYARYQCLGCEAAVSYLTHTSAYWKWWCRHFDIRDEIFLRDFGSYTQDELLDDVRDAWAHSHLPEQVEGRIPDPAWDQMLDAIRREEDAERPAVYSQNQ